MEPISASARDAANDRADDVSDGARGVVGDVLLVARADLRAIDVQAGGAEARLQVLLETRREESGDLRRHPAEVVLRLGEPLRAHRLLPTHEPDDLFNPGHAAVDDSTTRLRGAELFG